MVGTLPGENMDKNVIVPSNTTHAGIFDWVTEGQDLIRDASLAPGVRHSGVVL